jgi:hypothetical protein
LSVFPVLLWFKELSHSSSGEKDDKEQVSSPPMNLRDERLAFSMDDDDDEIWATGGIDAPPLTVTKVSPLLPLSFPLPPSLPPLLYPLFIAVFSRSRPPRIHMFGNWESTLHLRLKPS